jgi:hypothetical protein
MTQHQDNHDYSPCILFEILRCTSVTRFDEEELDVIYRKLWRSPNEMKSQNLIEPVTLQYIHDLFPDLKNNGTMGDSSSLSRETADDYVLDHYRFPPAAALAQSPPVKRKRDDGRQDSTEHRNKKNKMVTGNKASAAKKNASKTTSDKRGPTTKPRATTSKKHELMFAFPFAGRSQTIRNSAEGLTELYGLLHDSADVDDNPVAAAAATNTQKKENPRSHNIGCVKIYSADYERLPGKPNNPESKYINDSLMDLWFLWYV